MKTQCLQLEDTLLTFRREDLRQVLRKNLSRFCVWLLLLPAAGFAASPPSITTQPQSQSVVAGSNAVFTVVASGSPAPVYHWFFNNTNLANGPHIGGATSATLTVSNVVAGDAGNYQVVVTNSRGSATSSNATLTVRFRPSITNQPASQAVDVGAPVTFSVGATGTAPLKFQWRFNGSALSGQTNSTLSIAAAATNQAGIYTVAVTNLYGSVTSSNAVLQVTNAPPVISAIASQHTFPARATKAIAFTVGDLETPAASLAVTGAAADTNLVPVQNLVLGGSGTNRTVQITPASGVTGSTVVTLTVRDAQGATASTAFSLTVGDFSEVITNLPGLAGGVVRWVDFDNDGWLDLFLSGSDFNGAAHTRLYHNNGDGTFAELPTPLTNWVATSADWADFDGDGYVDLIAKVTPDVGLNFAWTYVYKNNGGTNLTQVASLPTYYVDGILLWADVDNDGRPDVLQITINYTWVYHNNGDGTFGFVSLIPSAASGAVADYDGDGWIDIMLPGYSFGGGLGSRLYRNIGTNGFVDSGLNFAILQGGFAAWGDVNNDGRPDVLLTGATDTTSDGTLTRLYRNDGGTFTSIATNLPSLRNSFAAWGDCDNDGKSDLFLTGFGGGSYQGKIFRNTGNDTFADLGSTLPGFNHGTAAWGDYDNDGALDLVCAGASGYIPPTTRLFHNVGAMPDTPPAAPGGLNVMLGHNSALLTWTASSDAEQSGGLTYNVRIGTITNGINILSPMADLTTGFRRVPQTGNAGYRQSFLITNLPAGTYFWSVQAIDNAFKGSLFATEQSFTLPAPIITNQPQSLAVSAGSPAAFTVGATGATPFSYQWQVNGTNISGATNSSLLINPAQFSDQGAYSVTVNNQYGSIASSNAILTVLTPPSFTQQPQGGTNVVGSLVSFSTAATGTTPFSYQWFFNGAPLADTGRLFGSTSNVFTIASVLKGDAGLYWLVVTNNYGSATSAVVSLAVTAPDILINVDFGSGTQSLKSGPAAIGQGAADFWNFYSVGMGALTNLLMADGTPTMARVSVSGAGPVAPVNGNPDPMYGHYLYQCCLPGNLTVVTTNLPPGVYDFYYYAGCGDYNYALSINGVSQGQRQVFGSGSGSTSWQEGVHYVVFRGVTLTNPASSVQTVITYIDSVCLEAVISGMQIAETFPAPAAPVFVSQPTNQTVVSGFNAGFQGGALGSPVIGYQWFFNNAPLADNGHITGAGTFSLAISNAQAADAGNYFLVASNFVGVSTSLVATLTVQLLPPVFVAQPTNQVVPPGSNVVFSAPATGSIPIGYQWFFNGAPVPVGANWIGSTSPSLAITSAQTNNTGNYFVVASNNVNVTTSSVALLFVGVPPSITQQPSSQTNYAGTTATLSVLASGTPPLSYQWLLNNVALADDAHRSGSAAATLTISNAQGADAGNYTVVVTNGAGSVTSLVAVLTVWTPPTITTQPLGRSVPPGLPTAFSAAASSVASLALTYQWQLNGTNIPGATNTSYSIAAVGTNDFGIYNFVASNAVGPTVSADARLTFGTVAAWGRNTSNESLPPPDLTNAFAVAGGAGVSFAARTDGSLVSWGGNIITNIPASATNVVGLSSSGGTVVLRSDGTITGWNFGTVASIPVPPSSNIVSVAAGYSFGFALRAEGTLVGWGGSPYMNVVSNLNHVTAIACGVGHSLALKDDGTVVSWGSGAVTNVPFNLTNVVGIAGGFSHSLALKADGTVVAWGSGAGTNLPAGLTNVAAIFCGGYPQGQAVSLAIRSNGTLVAWGDNFFGETNPPSALTNLFSVTGAGAAYHALAVVNDGSPLILRPPAGLTAFTGRDVTLRAAAVGASPLNYQWLRNGTNLPGATGTSLVISNVQSANAGSYQLVVSNLPGVAVSLPAPVTVMDGKPFILTQPATNLSVYLGSKFALPTTVAGSGPLQYQWRFNSNNVPGATNDTMLFDRVHMTNAGNYALVASNSFGAVTSAVTRLAVQQLVVWGSTSDNVTNMPAGLTNAAAISAGFNGNIVLRQDGTLTIWGNSGIIPTNSVAGISNVVEVSAGSGFNLVLRANGKPFAWGYNISAAFSNAVAAQSNIVAIEAGNFSCALLKTNGSVVLIASSGVQTGTAVNGLTNILSLEQFDDGFIALRPDGTVYGYNGGFTPPSSVSNVLAISSARYQGLAVKRDGTIQDWPFHLLPDGTSNIIAVAAAGGFNAGPEFAVRADGTIMTGGTGVATNVPSGLVRVWRLDAGNSHCLALLSDRDFPPVFLHNALNTSSYVVSSKGAPQWFCQTNISHDGVSAAQSAPIGINLSSSMRMWVAGPITVQFWWKVSSAANHGILSFSTGGTVLTNISGEVDWQQCTVSVPAGNQILQWTYSKDGSGSAGLDAAWVDQLQLIPQPPVISTQPAGQNVVGPTNVVLNVGVTGTPPLVYRWWKDGSLVPGANAASLALLNAVRTNSGTYWVVVTNAAATVTSSNAVLVVRVPQLLATPAFQPDGSILLFSTDAGGGLLSPSGLANFEAQVSTNLVDWMTLTNALSLTNGTLQLQDTGQSNSPSRFYRLLEH